MQAAEVCQVPQHTDIGNAVPDALDDVGAVPLVQADLHSGMLFEKCRDVVGQPFSEHRRTRQHPDAALDALAEGTDLGSQAFERTEHLAGASKERLAGSSGLDAAATTHEQRHPEFGFECGHALAECGADQGFPSRRARNAAFLAHRSEVLKGDGIQGTCHERSELERKG